MIRMISRDEAQAFAFQSDADAITFHKMRQLLGAPNAVCLSDGSDVLYVRTGSGWPSWIYTRRGIPDETLSALAASLCVLKEANNLSGVIGRASLVRYLELAMPYPTKRRLPLTAYVVEKPQHFTAAGARVPAAALDPAVCGDILAQLGEQAQEPIPAAERLAFGQQFCADPNACGWCINGTAVALARITERTDTLAYLGSVVTDNAHRRHGYGKALVSAVCAEEAEHGRRTMLYADTSYPASNALYRAIGFTEAGRLLGFDFV